MSTLRCKKCGGDLNIVDIESSLCECEYCGSKETLPKVDDEKIIKLYDRANRLRMSNEFDKASSVYESIIEESDSEAEAYWGLVLCKYGIEYVDDPATGDKVPTCHRLSFDSVMEDSDFELVMENAADTLSRNVYRENARQIEEIRRGIIEVSDKEDPYDIFICYKETDENGNRTVDSVMAQDIYDQLTTKGYRVFFSRITLEDKLGQEYEPYIFAALNSAKIMLAFGTSYDYYNAVWVKNEWSRYLKLMAKDKTKKIIPCYKDIDAYDIPTEFKHLQAQDMGKVGADQDLIRGIEKIINPTNSAANVQDIQAAVASAVAAHTGSNANALLERGFMSLEDSDFTKADSLFEEVLNQNPKYAEAYMGKLMAYYKVRNIEFFADKIYETIVSNDRITIAPDYDINSIIKDRYIIGNTMPKAVNDSIKKALTITYMTRHVSIEKLSEISDFTEYFCELNNNASNVSQLDDRYYSRYKQYATNEVLTRFDVTETIKKRLQAQYLQDKSKYEECLEKYSKDSFVELINEANLKVKSILGSEYDEIEAKYQAELIAWEESENSKQAAYEKECQYTKDNWLIIRAEAVEKWQKECEKLKEEYNKKKIEYADEKARIDSVNNKIYAIFNQAKADYENEIKQIDDRIVTAELDLSEIDTSKLGVFKKKKKIELQQNIEVLRAKRKSMNAPVIDSFGKILPSPDEVGELKLPNKPEFSDVPVMPKQPQPAEKPIRGEYSIDIDAVEILCEVMCEKHIQGYENVKRSYIEYIESKRLKLQEEARRKEEEKKKAEAIRKQKEYAEYVKSDDGRKYIILNFLETVDKATCYEIMNGAFKPGDVSMPKVSALIKQLRNENSQLVRIEENGKVYFSLPSKSNRNK